MLDVGSVIEAGKIADQSKAADGPPADIFDQAAIHFRLGGDHHGPAGKFTVIECEKEARTPIELLMAFGPHRKRTAVESSQRKKDRDEVPEFSPAAEAAGAQCGNISAESHA